MTTGLEGGEGSASYPGRSLPPRKTRYPLYRRLGGPQGRSGQVRKISPPPGFDPRTVQLIASRYTDWAPDYGRSVNLIFVFDNIHTVSWQQSMVYKYFLSKTLFCHIKLRFARCWHSTSNALTIYLVLMWILHTTACRHLLRCGWPVFCAVFVVHVERI